MRLWKKDEHYARHQQVSESYWGLQGRVFVNRELAFMQISTLKGLTSDFIRLFTIHIVLIDCHPSTTESCHLWSFVSSSTTFPSNDLSVHQLMHSHAQKKKFKDAQMRLIFSIELCYTAIGLQLHTDRLGDGEYPWARSPS